MAAADMAFLGLDPMKYLRAQSFERDIMTAVAKRVADLTDVRDKNLAVQIANNVGKLFSK